MSEDNGNGEDTLTQKSRALLKAVLKACEDLAETAGLVIVVVAAADCGPGGWECGYSLPEDRAMASRLLKQAQLEVARTVGMVSES